LLCVLYNLHTKIQRIVSSVSDNTVNKVFGHRVRQRRNEMGITLQELADTIGGSRSYLNQVELGKKNVTLEMAHKIASALDTTVLKLLE